MTGFKKLSRMGAFWVLLAVGALPSLKAEELSAKAEYASGYALAQAKNFVQALPHFQAATNIDPGYVAAWVAMGNCQYNLGQKVESLASFEKAQGMGPPDEALNRFVLSLKSQVGLPTGTPTPIPNPASPIPTVSSPGIRPDSLSALPARNGVPLKKVGFRLVSAYGWIRPGDLGGYAEALQAAIRSHQFYDPTATGSAKIPGGFPQCGLEIFSPLGPRLEVGLSAVLLPAGNVEYSAGNSSYFDSGAFKTSGFSVGLDGRYRFGRGRIQPFVGAGFFAAPLSLTWTETDYRYGFLTRDLTSSTHSTALGLQLRAGTAIKLGPFFVLSPALAYRVAKADGFKGHLQGTTPTGNFSDDGSFRVYHRDGFGTYPYFKPYSSTYSYPGERDLEVDLGGWMAEIALSASF